MVHAPTTAVTVIIDKDEHTGEGADDNVRHLTWEAVTINSTLGDITLSILITVSTDVIMSLSKKGYACRLCRYHPSLHVSVIVMLSHITVKYRRTRMHSYIGVCVYPETMTRKNGWCHVI